METLNQARMRLTRALLVAKSGGLKTLCLGEKLPPALVDELVWAGYTVEVYVNWERTDISGGALTPEVYGRQPPAPRQPKP